MNHISVSGKLYQVNFDSLSVIGSKQCYNAETHIDMLNRMLPELCCYKSRLMRTAIACFYKGVGWLSIAPQAEECEQDAIHEVNEILRQLQQLEDVTTLTECPMVLAVAIAITQERLTTCMISGGKDRMELIKRLEILTQHTYTKYSQLSVKF